MNRGFEIERLCREKAEKSQGLNELCIWKKKKTDGFWTNRGFENIRDYIWKKSRKIMGLKRTVYFEEEEN